MTFNIRLDTPADGDNQWKYRKEKVAQTVQFFDIDICGMQEVLHNQKLDLINYLSGYTVVGVARDDAKEKGEYSCIWYKTEKFKLLQSGTFWLNEHPDTPGFGWDAKHNRIVTWVELKPKKGRSFFVFNTHFDHIAETARRESAKLVLQKISDLAGTKPTILMGDFNATPDTEPIQILLAEPSVKNTESQSLGGHFGSESSFNGFLLGSEATDRKIDHIFTKNYPFKVYRHGTISQSWNGRYASDHMAVMVELGF